MRRGGHAGRLVFALHSRGGEPALRRLACCTIGWAAAAPASRSGRKQLIGLSARCYSANWTCVPTTPIELGTGTSVAP